ncbi:S1 family peptidase [Photobacterium lutimaris]|uniref:Serine protease n=1 Tax=Photobacterium lutimaris TaxID=388278 RepID=A0A2T3J3T5_9GAMM|nr:serine protease [Photobacterium lutimaris]PSU35962.1 serine protease [Photobacterium lutimaris]TDR79047.1 trypsin [Photobacterium lutimaris]
MKKQWFKGLALVPLFVAGGGFASDISSYVVGGKPVKPSEDYSWMASVRNTTQDTSHFCGGSVVNENWVLTAAHCVVQPQASGKYGVVPPNELAVMVGSLTTEVTELAHLYPVTHVVVYPKYSPDPEIKVTIGSDGSTSIEVLSLALDNDIALLRIKGSFPSDAISPVTLATSDMASDIQNLLDEQWDDTIRPENVLVSGWGSTNKDGTGIADRLMAAKLSFLPTTECFNRLELGNDAHYILDSPANQTKVCALPPDLVFDQDGNSEGYGPDSCKGDSGGPLLAKDPDDRWVQIGVVSGGPLGSPLCGAYLRPGFYARVGTYYDWIEQTVGTIPDAPISNPDFIGDADSDGSGSGSGKEDEVNKDCNPNVEGISPNNCALKKSGGGSTTLVWLGVLLGLALLRRSRI